MGLLYNKDLDKIQLGFIKEAAYLRGTDVLFFETLSEEKNIYTDIEVESLGDPIKVAIIMQEYPQNRKTLQRVGWYNKDADDNPTIAYVPLDLDILRRWQNILIPGRIDGQSNKTQWRRYQTTRISTTMDHPHYYLIALAPVFADNAPKLDRNENTNFIDFNNIDPI